MGDCSLFLYRQQPGRADQLGYIAQNDRAVQLGRIAQTGWAVYPEDGRLLASRERMKRS